MQIGSKQWIDLVMRAASQMGIQVSENQAARFARHAQVLLAWSQKVNLTAITDPVDMAIKHFVDCLAPLNYIPVNASVLDMGTGGGFPGLPLKIMRPLQPMVLIDSVRKKINFVRHIIRLLELPDIEALHVRAEDLACNPLYQSRFDVIVCRALSDLNRIAALAAPLLVQGGTVIAMKGPKAGPRSSDEADEDSGSWQLENAQYCFNVSAKRYLLPPRGDMRSILLLKSN